MNVLLKLKKVIFSLIILLNFSYGSSNLEYFKKYIDFNRMGSKAPSLHDELNYNMGGVYISSSIENEYCKYEYSLIPYFQIKSFKNPHFITNANTHKFGVKQGSKIGDFPRMEVIIYNTQEGDDYCQSIANKLRKNPYIRFTAQETASTKDKLKDRRFDDTNERNTIKVGSLIEKVLVQALKQKSIFFLKKYNNYDMTIKIEDLCYGNNKINSCDDDTLTLKVDKGLLTTFRKKEYKIKNFSSPKNFDLQINNHTVNGNILLLDKELKQCSTNHSRIRCEIDNNQEITLYRMYKNNFSTQKLLKCYQKENSYLLKNNYIFLPLDKNLETDIFSCNNKLYKVVEENEALKEKKFHGKLGISIDSIERFQYSDQKYYFFFYKTKESCLEDIKHETNVKVVTVFTRDIEDYKIDNSYKWVKGIEVDICFQGIYKENKLNFGI